MAERKVIEVSDFLSTHLDDDKFAKYISNILNSIINSTHVESREVPESTITEHILLGDPSKGDFSKLIVSNKSSDGETKKEYRFEKNYVYVDGESQERKRFRIVCKFYGIDNVLILLGYGNKFEKEIVIRLQELLEGNGSFGINFYQDLSSLREKRIGVTKDDAIVFAQNGITPSLSLCCWIDSNQYKDIIRSVLTDPKNAVEIIETLLSQKITEDIRDSIVSSVIDELIAAQQSVEPNNGGPKL